MAFRASVLLLLRALITVAAVACVGVRQTQAEPAPTGVGIALAKSDQLLARADSLRNQNDLDGAIQAAKQALAIRESALGSSHPSLGPVLDRLADYYRYRANYAVCESTYRRAVAVQEVPAAGGTPGSRLFFAPTVSAVSTPNCPERTCAWVGDASARAFSAASTPIRGK